MKKSQENEKSNLRIEGGIDDMELVKEKQLWVVPKRVELAKGERE